jgi:4-hydroxythreonine-4-phosphate dehydrogenase
MYHDQGLTPFKALNFHSGVNFTAGLSAVRTSPDHGVGYDIAGKGIANEQSFREAVFCAVDVFKNRKEQISLEANQLIPRKKGKTEEE